MMLWVSASHSLSTCLICSAMSQAGGSEDNMRSSRVAPETIRSARVMKSAKNFSSRGISRKRTPESMSHGRYMDVTSLSATGRSVDDVGKQLIAAVLQHGRAE